VTTNERLDETIDRVAQAMTAVPADPAFGARLSRRLQRRTGNVTSWVLAASAAAAVLVATLVLSRPVADQPATVVRHDALASAAPAASASARAELLASYGETSPKRPADREGGPAAPAAAAPTGVEDIVPALRVAALTLEPLTLADVDISPLDVAGLEIADIDSGAEPKEPK
jgi:hypothetical protein